MICVGEVSMIVSTMMYIQSQESPRGEGSIIYFKWGGKSESTM